jgi:surfactin synthase thioesterase subunit
MGKVIYCISGLGADEKVFNNLELNGHDLRHIPWLKPKKKETIVRYASRMREQIRESPAILLGVSFGGMIGIEIAKQMQLEKLIIVSSIKNAKELPSWMKYVGQLQLNKFLPIRSYKFIEKIDNDRLGVSNEEERKMVQAYRRAADRVYMNWAVNEVLNWKNDWLPENIVHIHGDKDKIFPIKKISASHVVKNGTHLMIYNRGKEISEFIREELK